MKKVKIGVIGCGMISEIYIKNCTERFGNVEVVACADIYLPAAEKRAAQFGFRYETVEELLADPEVEVVLNLTIPSEHSKVSMRALKAGKSVYTEKPMAIDKAAGEELVKYAKEHGLFVGNAPDCFLGGGLQTCRKLLDEGIIGKPFAAQAFMFTCGPEWFHPNPEFFYQEGAGPVLDWGPYYISALVALFGPVKKIVSMGKKPKDSRVIMTATSPKVGQEFPVEVPTYVSSLMEFDNNMMANVTLSFDMHYPYWEADMPFLRVYGTEGSMDVPDLNKYEGPILVRNNKGEVTEYPLQFGFTENSRGMGLSDMANAMRNGVTYRANADFGLHIAEVLCDIQKSAVDSKEYVIENKCEIPEQLPMNLPDCLYQ